MALRFVNQFGIKLLKDTPVGFLCPAANSQHLETVRHRRIKHWNPKWKLFRKLKVIKVDLPNYNEDPSLLSEEEMRSRMKEKGILPPRPWLERPFSVSCTGAVFEAYIPPEGDGKVSSITAQGAKQNIQFLEKKTKTMMAIRKIRSFEEDFDTKDFCKEAEEIYKRSHQCLATKDKHALRECVTERAYPEIMHNVYNKTIRWKFLKNIELPRVVHARCTDIVTKDNIFAQITVRFHTQQTLAIYDRFGRLVHGSEIIAKDVLEYVVFEKHIANEYGIWRIHDKIIPDWMPPKDPSALTYKKTPESAPAVQESEEKSVVKSEVQPDQTSPSVTTA